MAARDPVIVGVGLSDYPKAPHLSTTQHHAQAMQRALADAGLPKSAIDGYASAGMGAGAGTAIVQWQKGYPVPSNDWVAYENQLGGGGVNGPVSRKTPASAARGRHPAGPRKLKAAGPARAVRAVRTDRRGRSGAVLGRAAAAPGGAEALRAAVIAGVKASRHHRVSLPLGGRRVTGRVVGATDEGIVLKLREAQMKLAWSALTPSQLKDLGRSYLNGK